MANDILNENLEEVIETPVEDTTEEPIVDTMGDDELIDEEMMVVPEELPIDEEMMVMPEETLMEELPPQRVNPFCVVSKKTFGEYNVRDIQTNGAWGSNPYGDDYAVVPDEMVPAIMETRGFCDIELNEDGTEVVSFTALEIPEIPVPKDEPSQLDVIEAQVTYTALMTDTLLGV